MIGICGKRIGRTPIELPRINIASTNFTNLEIDNNTILDRNYQFPMDLHIGENLGDFFGTYKKGTVILAFSF